MMLATSPTRSLHTRLLVLMTSYDVASKSARLKAHHLIDTHSKHRLLII
jgi:hypothetical protein